MRVYTCAAILLLGVCGDLTAFPCSNTYYAQEAELISMTGSGVNSLQKSGTLKLRGNWDAIPKIPGINYRIPVQFTSTCDDWGEKTVVFAKRDSNQVTFSESEQKRFTLFANKITGLPDNAYFILSKDKQTEIEFLPMGDKSIQGFYGAARYDDTIRTKLGQLRLWGRGISPWWIDLDSARYIDSLKTYESWKNPPPTGDSLVLQRQIAVQMLKVKYDSVKPVGIFPASQKPLEAVKISRTGGLIKIALPKDQTPARMKILTTNGKLVRELHSNSNVFLWDGASFRKDIMPQGLYLFEAGGSMGKLFLIPN